MLKKQVMTLLFLCILIMEACKPEGVVSAKLFAALSELTGKVDAKQAGQETFAPASADSKLEVNGQIQTGDDGRVRLDLSSGTIIRVAPSSLFTLTSNDEVEIVLAFSKVHVIGKEEYGKWYQIIYNGSPDGKGWVAVAYVQMDATAEIPVVEIESGSGHGISALVIQGINVRSGPGTTYESLGTLIPNDIVTVTGKDPSGAWMEIEFASAPAGKGWAASEFLQVNNPDALPVIGDVAQTVESETPASIPLTLTPSQMLASQDGDSMASPFASVIFSPSGVRALQVKRDVSAPDGDIEDWVQFTSFTANILAEVKCSNNELRVELWNNGHNTSDIVLACGEQRLLIIEPAQPYFFRIQANSNGNLQYIQYSLKISSVE